MRLFSASLAGWVQPADIFVQFYAGERNAFWLDGEFSPDERFSVLGSGLLTPGDRSVSEKLANLRATNAVDLPFRWRPGLVGFLTYECEPKFLDVDRAIVFDHDHQGLYFTGVFSDRSAFESWHHAALLRLGLSGGQLATYLHQLGEVPKPSQTRLVHDSEKYLGLIRKAQQHIALGDVYQICLTNQIEIHTEADPLAVFLKLRLANPAPYSAFMQIDGRSVISSSPEQFIRVTNSGQVSTKPIKGTRPRGLDEFEDESIAASLRDDTKERAENLMIVDLMRNDLGKVSEIGSVAVDKLFAIETYATVHQLVSTVSGTLASGQDAWSAALAAFPGGSMTGAPKIRAMQIIAELEQTDRGVYSGCLGYFAADGAAELAMVIRSIVFEGGVARIGVGGGITIDSEPRAELAETRLKAQALLTALNAPDPWS